MAFTPIIYTYGGGQGLNSLFESLSILFDFNKHSEILWIGRISAVLGVIWISMSGFASRGKDGSPGAIDWTWFLRFAMIWIVLIVPKTTVEIQDKITKATYSVSGAPWSLSIFGWFTSSLGYGMTSMYENVLGGGINTATSYSGNGFAFGSSYYNSLPKVARFEGTNSTSAVFPFIQECLIPAAGPINSTWSGITKQTLLTTSNYVTAIQGLSTNFLQNRYVNVDGVSVTCLTLRDRVLTQWNSDSLILLKQFNLTENQIAPLDNAFIGTATGGSANSLKQAMMMNAIQDAALAGSIQWGDAAMADSLAQAQAQMQQTSAWRQGSQFATVSLVWLHNAAEIITYAIFPFLLFLILLPVGFSVLMEYLKVLFWLQTWPILYAILNFIIGVYATSQSQQMALQYGGFTMSDFYKIGDMNDGIVSTAGYLCTLVPVLTWMFLQRAGMAIASAVGGFTGAINNTAESAGKQEALGSMDINRVSVEETNTAGNRTIGESQTLVHGSGVDYKTQGGITTATEHKMGLLQEFKQTHSKEATTTVALNNAIAQQQESATVNSHAVSNMLTSAKGNNSQEQFVTGLTNAIGVNNKSGTSDTGSEGASDAKIKQEKMSVGTGGILAGASGATAVAVGRTLGGVMGTAGGPAGTMAGMVVGGLAAKAIFETVGKMLSMDKSWAAQHQNDVASKTTEQIGAEATNQIAVNYAKNNGYSETASFQQQSQQADQSLASFKAASSKVDTYSKMAQNSESNSATESDTNQVMRDKFNQHITEGMSYDQARVQTLADMHKLVTEMPMNEINPINDDSGKNSHLAKQGFVQYKVDEMPKGDVNAHTSTAQQITNQNRTLRGKVLQAKMNKDARAYEQNKK